MTDSAIQMHAKHRFLWIMCLQDTDTEREREREREILFFKNALPFACG
jgi:hypothetical protein